MNKIWTSLLVILLTGCIKSAHLYPANDAASEVGMVEIQYIAWGTGHTNVEIKMPNAEILKGETSLVRGGTIGFGTIFASVYGTDGAASGNATSTSITMPGGSPGRASVFGDQGSYGECEFFNDNWSGHGYGACKIAHKAQKDQLFRLQY